MGREWFDRVAIPADSDTSPAFRFLRWSQLSVAAEFAVFENDPQQLKLTCERFVDSSFNDLGYRTTRARVILHSLLNHLRGEQQDPQELARALTIEQVTGHEFGVIGDFEMVALITILRDTGYAAFAADQLREYLTERRRPQVAISANLRRVAASIGVTELDRLRDRSQGTNRETE